MLYVGMIFQYDTTQKSGLLMLSDGEKKNFNITQWVDKENSPAVGQKISYREKKTHVEIQVATEADEAEAASPQEPESSAEEDAKEFVVAEYETVDEYINYYTSIGFKLVKDTKDGSDRIVTLRFYTPEDYGETIIKEDTSKISLKQTMNGQVAINR